MKKELNCPDLYMESETLCPIKIVTNLISGKWKILILWHLSQKNLRLGEFQRLLPDVSKGVLVKHLHELLDDNLILRTVYNEVPLKVEYSLSETGKCFAPVLDTLRVWGNDYINKYYKD